MSASPRTIVVFGTGPQLGTSIAGRFASEGFDHLVLLSRNASRLEEDKKAVIAAAARGNIRVDTVTVDLSSEESVQKALQQVDGLVGAVEVVLYNGARVAPTPLFETPAEDIVNDFKTTTIGLYLVSQWAIPKLQALAKSSRSSKPSLIVTSGILHREPYPTFFSLSLVKTAQRNLVDTLHRVYSQDGIHIGLVLVGGIVSSDAKAVNPANVASVTWDFFHQEAHKDKLEIEIIES